MWLEIEGEQLINLDLVERVEFQDRYKTVKLWASSVVIADSATAYRWFMSKRGDSEFVIPMTQEVVKA